jgi:hypothetical protein
MSTVTIPTPDEFAALKKTAETLLNNSDTANLLHLINFALSAEEAESYIPELVDSAFSVSYDVGQTVLRGLKDPVKNTEAERRMEKYIQQGNYDGCLIIAEIRGSQLSEAELRKLIRSAYAKTRIDDATKACQALKELESKTES